MNKNLIVKLAHYLIEQEIRPNDTVIDATMGHGYDTLFLARLAHKVYAFDIQDSALKSTEARLKSHQIHHVNLILDSHENILNYVQSFKGVLFNLGYLPHGDKSITTQATSTVHTLIKVIPVLPKDGFICIVCYLGHKEGILEYELITTFLKELDPKIYQIIKIHLPFQDNLPPLIYFIKKKSVV